MSNAPSFKRATKKDSKLRLALIGPPGAGKTYTGLVVARALGGRIALIDTESGSASKYADIFDFDAWNLTESFHPKRYVEAIKAAEEAGYDSIVIDSLSHAWIGTDGGLDLHDKAVARQKTKNSYTAWGDVTPHHNALVQAVLQSKCHIIATMRTKVEYVQEEANGKKQIRKVGTAPLMRDGVEYEFDAVGDMDLEHNLNVVKTRCPAIDGKVFNKPDKAFYAPLLLWLRGSPPSAQEERQQAEEPKPAGNGHGKKMPANGTELSTRLRDYEDQLFKNGVIPRRGELVKQVQDAVLKAFPSLSPNMELWGPQAVSKGYNEAARIGKAMEEAVSARDPGGDEPE